MKILVNRKSAVSLQQQIVSEIENRIKSGILTPESRLPSVRQLAEETGVSLMTVVNAYNQLAHEGLVDKTQGRGTFVRSPYRDLSLTETEYGWCIDNGGRSDGDGQLDSDLWQDQVQDYISRGSFRHNTDLSLRENGVNLSMAVMGKALLPTKEIFDQMSNKEAWDIEALGSYPPVEGGYGMRHAVKTYLSDRNVDVSVDNILITSGSQLAINLIAMTFIGPGDVVVVGAPTYPGAIDVFKNRGAHIVEVPVDDYGMDTVALLSVCETYPVKMVYVMPCFQNPTGSVMPLERKQMLLELSGIHNFLIIEDDVWSQIAFEGTAEPLKALDQYHRVIYICGFSKLYSPAYRLSAVVTKGSLYTRLVAAKSNLDMGAPLLNQQLLANYLNSLEQKQYLLKMTYELKGLRDRTYRLLKACSPEYVQITKPKGGFVFWLTFPMEFNCQLLYYRGVTEQNISFLPGDYCYAERRGSNQLRLCFTYEEEKVLIASIKKLCHMMDEVYAESRRYRKRPVL